MGRTGHPRSTVFMNGVGKGDKMSNNEGFFSPLFLSFFREIFFMKDKLSALCLRVAGAHDNESRTGGKKFAES